MFDLEASLLALFAVALLMAVVWAVHLRDEDASIVDPLWGLAIWLVGFVHALGAGAPLRGGRLVVLLVAGAWALRLAVHLHVRHGLQGEDRRYTAMREKRGAAVLAALFGFFFEAIADGQLAAFKGAERRAAPGSTEERAVMDRGLWRYSRHPNYFGEAVVWWGLGLVGVAAGAWWCLLGPVTITFMLLKVSGVSLTEADIAERRPSYRSYVLRTNAFIPGRPKQA